MQKCIVLCADDYGQGLAISEGILLLLAKKRLSATSCLVTSPCWSEHAKWLAPYQAHIDIGLHFNLTEGRAISNAYRTTYGDQFKPVSHLLLRTFLHQLRPDLIEIELKAQLAAFIESIGKLPDFIDGHQHIHQFPVIREVIGQVVTNCFINKKFYLRWVKPLISWQKLLIDYKKLIILFSGSKSFQALLEKHHIAHNLSFSGIYDFKKAPFYQNYFPKFLAEITHKGLLMCHPGHASDGTQDLIQFARPYELQYLLSSQFLYDLDKANVKLGQFF